MTLERRLPPCPRCQQAARLLGLEIATVTCYRCGKDVRILDVIDHSGEELVTIAAGSPDLKGIETIAREVGVTVRRTFSKTAGSTYLMHHCGWCGAKQGDNFVYQPEDGSVVLSEPIRFFTYWSLGARADPRVGPKDARSPCRKVS